MYTEDRNVKYFRIVIVS